MKPQVQNMKPQEQDMVLEVPSMALRSLEMEHTAD